MADVRSKNEKPAAEGTVQRPQRQEPRRWERRDQPAFSPFSLMRQGIDEMDQWFSRLGFGRSAPSPRRWFEETSAQMMGDWSPAVEAFQRGNEFVVRVEAPGMDRKDISVEAGDDSLTIRGERKQEHQEEREGAFWTERSYGSFCRVIPLPPGALTDSAKASFKDGVLEVVMQAPSQEVRRGRQIEISGGPEKS